MLSKQKIKWGIKASINFITLVCWFISIVFFHLYTMAAIVMIAAQSELDYSAYFLFAVSLTMIIAYWITVARGDDLPLPFEQDKFGRLPWLPKITWMIALCFMLSANSYASDSIIVKRQGKEFVQTRVQKKTEAVDTGFKWTEETRDGDKLTYHVYINPNTGSCWYDKLSKNGKTYKKYLPKEYSKEISKELGITYKDRSNGTK